MTIQGKEYRPRYLIRMLGKLYNELILNNVFSIKTGIFTNRPDGAFEIILDNRYSINERYGLFNVIQPMDYIEIFMTRDQIVKLGGNFSSSIAGRIKPQFLPPDFTTSQQTQAHAVQLQALSQWGYVDATGLSFHPASHMTYSAPDGSAPLFTKDSAGNYVTNGGFPDAVYSSSAELIPLKSANVALPSPQNLARPLSPAEKVNTPTFVFCGLVDTVTSSFSMSPDGKPVPHIRISGRSMGKLLVEQRIYSNSVIFNPLVPLGAQIDITTKPPNYAVKKVIDLFLKNTLNLLFDPTSDSASQQAALKAKLLSNTISEFKIVLPTTGLPYKLNFPLFHRNFLDVLSYTEQGTTDGNPIDDYSGLVAGSPPYQFNGQPNYLGRLLNPALSTIPQFIFHLSNISDGPIWSTLESIANSFLNEMWVDEAGRLVLRPIQDAWFQDIFQTVAATSDSPPSTVGPDSLPVQQIPLYDIDPISGNPIPRVLDSYYVVPAEDIIDWQLDKTDKDLVTLVMVQDVYNLLGVYTNSRLAAMAPLTTEGRDLITTDAIGNLISALTFALPVKGSGSVADLNNSIQPILNDPTLSASNKIANVEQKISAALSIEGKIILEQEPDLFKASLAGLADVLSGKNSISSQPMTIWTYNFRDDSSVVRYWQDFLMRPKVIPSAFSQNFSDALFQAEVYFQQYSAMMAGGSVRVKGIPSYKAGTRLYFEFLNADFYVTGVEHEFPWGSGPYTTVLHVSRGIFHGRSGGFYPAGTIDTSSDEIAAAAASDLVAKLVQ